MYSEDNPIKMLMSQGVEAFGKFYSLYRAVVTNNEDPLHLNRVQVIVPQLEDLPLPNWAFPGDSWGGKDYGIQILPQKGDFVWIQFEMGNVNNPIWTHSSFAIDEKPEEFINSNVYGFKTPRGSLVLINDNEEQESIEIRLNSTTDWIKVTKDIVEIESLKIKLGKEESEKAVLGDTLKDKLDQILDKLDQLHDTLITHTHTTPSGPSGPPIQVSKLNETKQALTEIKESIPEILSNKVTID